MSKSGLNFGVPGMFGTLGNNQMINSLTNANAMAAQQAAAQQINTGAQSVAQPAGSGMIMDPSISTFNPAVQNVGMGIFGAKDARNRSLYPSALMAHNAGRIKELQKQIQEAKARGEKYGGDKGAKDYDVMSDVEQDIKAYTAEIKKLSEAHNKETKEK